MLIFERSDNDFELLTFSFRTEASVLSIGRAIPLPRWRIRKWHKRHRQVLDPSRQERLGRGGVAAERQRQRRVITLIQMGNNLLDNAQKGIRVPALQRKGPQRNNGRAVPHIKRPNDPEGEKVR